jgi:hypothetical protein
VKKEKIKAEPSEEVTVPPEPIPDTPRPITGMSREHCLLFIHNTVERILYNRIRSIIAPKHLDWRVALHRCTAFLLSHEQKSDEELAQVNSEEDLHEARINLAQFFASGFNDW